MCLLLSCFTCLTKHIYVGIWCAFGFCTLSTEIVDLTGSTEIVRKLAVRIRWWRNIDIAEYLTLTIWLSHPYLASTTAQDQRRRVYLFLSDSRRESFTFYLQLRMDDLEDLEGVECITQTVNLWREFFWRGNTVKSELVSCLLWFNPRNSWQTPLGGSPASAPGHRLKGEASGSASSAALLCLRAWHTLPVRRASLGSPAKEMKVEAGDWPSQATMGPDGWQAWHKRRSVTSMWTAWQP